MRLYLCLFWATSIFSCCVHAECAKQDIFNSFSIDEYAAEIRSPESHAEKCFTGRGLGGFVSMKAFGNKIAFIGECLRGDQTHVWQSPDLEMVEVPNDLMNTTELQFAGEKVGEVRTASNWAQLNFRIIQGDQILSGLFKVSCGPLPFSTRVSFELQRQNTNNEWEFWGQAFLEPSIQPDVPIRSTPRNQ